MSESDPSIHTPKHHSDSVRSDILNEASGRVQSALDSSLSEAEERKKQLYTQKIVVLLAGWKDDQLSQKLADVLYEFLTRRHELALASKDIAEIMQDMQPQRNWYEHTREVLEKYLSPAQSEYLWESNPAWFGVNVFPQAGEKTSGNFKAYTTLPLEEYSFIRHLPDLAGRLREIAIATDDTIKVKVPNTLSGFVGMNDSIVVHFKDPNNQTAIFEVLESWMTKYQIQQSPRELGRTRIAADSARGSFSEIVAESIANWVLAHRGSYPDDVLTSEAIKHTVDQASKQPKITHGK